MRHPPLTRTRGRAIEVARDVARALVPVACPGCSEKDVVLCEGCAAVWWEPPWRSETGAGRLAISDRASFPVWSVAPLSGPAHGTIAAWKDGGRRDLDTVLPAALRRAARALAPALGVVPGGLGVVPAPSRPANVRRRGVDLPALLAKAVVEGLCEAGVETDHSFCLRIGRGDSRTASARGRWRDAATALVVSGSTPPTVLLVDDVVTTGATLAAAVVALERAGSAVVGAITLAATDSTTTTLRNGLG